NSQPDQVDCQRMVRSSKQRLLGNTQNRGAVSGDKLASQGGKTTEAGDAIGVQRFQQALAASGSSVQQRNLRERLADPSCARRKPQEYYPIAINLDPGCAFGQLGLQFRAKSAVRINIQRREDYSLRFPGVIQNRVTEIYRGLAGDLTSRKMANSKGARLEHSLKELV